MTPGDREERAARVHTQTPPNSPGKAPYSAKTLFPVHDSHTQRKYPMSRRNKAGRKRKDGERHKCGKLRIVYDRGNDRIAAMRARYGEHYSTGLGRAYASGLLGFDQRAVETDGLADHRYQAGKRFARLIARFFPDGVGCTLDTSPRGGSPFDGPHDFDDWQWLRDASARLGFAREWLDPLLSVSDHGPAWLDCAIIARDRHAVALRNATLALDLIAGPLRTSGIVSVTA